jgi:hypothetical protein
MKIGFVKKLVELFPDLSKDNYAFDKLDHYSAMKFKPAA